MRIAQVVFDNGPLSLEDAKKRKQYSFIVDENIKVGQTLSADRYSSFIQVVNIIDTDELKVLYKEEEEDNREKIPVHIVNQ